MLKTIVVIDAEAAIYRHSTVPLSAQKKTPALKPLIKFQTQNLLLSETYQGPCNTSMTGLFRENN